MSLKLTRSSATNQASVIVGPVTFRTRPLALLLLLLLAVQFLLGMVTNLYVQLPDNHPGSGAANFFVGVLPGLGWAITHGAWSLQLHVLVGVLLILTSILFMGLAYTTRERVWMVIAPLGIFGMLLAGFNGVSFLNHGIDLSSLLMSIGFLLALVSLLIGLYLTPRTSH